MLQSDGRMDVVEAIENQRFIVVRTSEFIGDAGYLRDHRTETDVPDIQIRDSIGGSLMTEDYRLARTLVWGEKLTSSTAYTELTQALRRPLSLFGPANPFIIKALRSGEELVPRGSVRSSRLG